MTPVLHKKTRKVLGHVKEHVLGKRVVKPVMHEDGRIEYFYFPWSATPEGELYFLVNNTYEANLLTGDMK